VLFNVVSFIWPLLLPALISISLCHYSKVQTLNCLPTRSVSLQLGNVVIHLLFLFGIKEFRGIIEWYRTSLAALALQNVFSLQQLIKCVHDKSHCQPHSWQKERHPPPRKKKHNEYFPSRSWLTVSLNSSVGIATDYGLDDWSSSPGGGWEFFSSTPYPGWFWGPPSLLSNGYWRLFPWR
jgi:hypothetical protein